MKFKLYLLREDESSIILVQSEKVVVDMAIQSSCKVEISTFDESAKVNIKIGISQGKINFANLFTAARLTVGLTDRPGPF